ncbi:MAG: hypothetical protein WBE76_17155 [Terracidiphilus sp.]
MNSKAFVLLLAFGALAPGLSAHAQQPAAAAQAPACQPTGTLDQLIKAIDAAVSGPADKDRACFRDVMLPDARLMPIVKSADGSFAPRILTVDGWIDAVRKRGSQVFYERQVKVSTETWGHMAHLWSTYETRATPDGKPEVRGINSIQAVFDGQRWKVISILWQAETPAEPVPEKYLP